MRYFAEVNARLANQQSWRKRALCSLPEHATLTPWFTADNVPDDIRKQMRSLCAECPVRQDCLSVALGATGNNRATAGFWAGRSYNQWGGTGD